MEKLYIGILFRHDVFSGSADGETGYENLLYYEEAAEKYCLKPCYIFLSNNLLVGDKVVVKIFDKQLGFFEEEIPIPKLIYNRAIGLTKNEKQRIQQWIDAGILFYNHWNPLNYFKIYNILKRRVDFNPYINEMMLANDRNLREMMHKYRALILRAYKGDRTRITLLQFLGDGWYVSYKTIEGWTTIPYLKGQTILDDIFSSRDFLIEKQTPFVEIDGIPLKLGAIVQRNEKGVWQVTGIQTNQILQPVSFLKTSLNSLYQIDYNWVCMSVEILALQIVQEIAKYSPFLTDLRIDIGVDQEGHPVFLKCIGRYPRRFFGTHQNDMMKASYLNPIGYGRFLIDNLNTASNYDR